MFNFPVWDVCGIIAIAFLAVSFRGRRTATWAGLLLGFIIALIIALVYFMKDGADFNWLLIKKICIVATLAGALFDIVKSIVTPRTKKVE